MSNTIDLCLKLPKILCLKTSNHFFNGMYIWYMTRAIIKKRMATNLMNVNADVEA